MAFPRYNRDLSSDLGLDSLKIQSGAQVIHYDAERYIERAEEQGSTVLVGPKAAQKESKWINSTVNPLGDCHRVS